MNIPNTVTLIRIALIPIFVMLFWLPFDWTNLAAAGVFLLGALSDWLDGYLARRLSQTSRLGAFLDPVADKLIVCVALVLLLQRDPTIALAVPVLVIIGREITVSALREWMAELGARNQVSVSGLGKLKTITQMVALVLMIARDAVWGVPLYALGFAALYTAAALTLWSMLVYLRAAWPALSKE